MTLIELRVENGETFLVGDWPDETVANPFLLDGTWPHVERDRDLLVFRLTNADAVYRIGDVDMGCGCYRLTKVRASRRAT